MVFLIEGVAIYFSITPFLFGRSIKKTFQGASITALSLILCTFKFTLLAIVISIVFVFYISRKNSSENYKKLLEKARY
ncbi:MULTISPECIES: hypothetical protein [unclassified Francisella]|uniref:hypothetical protein n=1 Tax=unclassified Francisella TaxID=2610885 RepID=UPI002E35421D|nr:MULTISPECIES: hypothetical protein [unclassified Francisella]MED7820013.1 hypothetical protein [Francisella sp. 19S2-4]MED7830833.1 hypothetical protein [Francisella sp. 19S2-10]